MQLIFGTEASLGLCSTVFKEIRVSPKTRALPLVCSNSFSGTFPHNLNISQWHRQQSAIDKRSPSTIVLLFTTPDETDDGRRVHVLSTDRPTIVACWSHSTSSAVDWAWRRKCPPVLVFCLVR